MQRGGCANHPAALFVFRRPVERVRASAHSAQTTVGAVDGSLYEPPNSCTERLENLLDHGPDRVGHGSPSGGCHSGFGLSPYLGCQTAGDRSAAPRDRGRRIAVGDSPERPVIGSSAGDRRREVGRTESGPRVDRPRVRSTALDLESGFAGILPSAAFLDWAGLGRESRRSSQTVARRPLVARSQWPALGLAGRVHLHGAGGAPSFGHWSHRRLFAALRPGSPTHPDIARGTVGSNAERGPPVGLGFGILVPLASANFTGAGWAIHPFARTGFIGRCVGPKPALVVSCRRIAR